MFIEWSHPNTFARHRLPGYLTGLRLARYVAGSLSLLSLLAL